MSLHTVTRENYWHALMALQGERIALNQRPWSIRTQQENYRLARKSDLLLERYREAPLSIEVVQ